MLTALGPLLVISAFALYMATNVWLGRFRSNPWEFFALALVGAGFSIARAVAVPSTATATVAALSVLGVGALYWFFYAFSMYEAREDRPRVGDTFPAFRLPSSDGEMYDSACARGKPQLLIFYRGSW
jgi:hypothetical protein